MTDAQKCSACEEPLSDGVMCTKCKREMHFHCAGITEIGYRRMGERKLTWRCLKCKQLTATLSPTSDPLKPQRTEPESAVLQEIRALSAKLAPLEGLRDDIIALKNEFADLRSFNIKIEEVIKEFSCKLNNLEERIVTLEKVEQHVNQLQTRLDQLEEDSNSKEQFLRMNNVEIKGISQTGNENLFDIITKIGAKINHPVSKNQINFITRVPTREKDVKPIIVSFCNRYVKENFIAAARLETRAVPITTSHIGFSGNGKIYINDHLTTKNKLLLSKTKKIASEKNFHYVWVKHAQIHVRKMDTSPVLFIKSEKDLLKLM